MSKALTIALNQRRSAELEVGAVLKRDYPVGAPVAWTRGSGGVRFGVVVMNSGNDRIKVRNSETGAEFWIRAYAIYSDF